MRLLVDANMSPVVAGLLAEGGHDAIHVREVGLARAGDDEIMKFARAEDRVVVTEDTDFGALLSKQCTRFPSVILMRSAEPITPGRQALLLLTNLPNVQNDLREGAIVTLARGRLRVRALPVVKDREP